LKKNKWFLNNKNKNKIVMRKNWQTSEVKELKKLYQQGFKAPEISKILERSQQSIDRALSRYALRAEAKLKKPSAIIIPSPTVKIGAQLAPISYKFFNFKKPNSLNSTTYLSHSKAILPEIKPPIQEKLKIKIYTSQETFNDKRKSQTFEWGGLETEIKWAHDHTSLRILPIRKANSPVIFYVRCIKNTSIKQYIQTKPLLNMLNKERINLRLPLFEVR
tara:strand:+ start:8914 stop:9570 length:657 start_codon:yes stop_codon:yes gene_type:complete